MFFKIAAKGLVVRVEVHAGVRVGGHVGGNKNRLPCGLGPRTAARHHERHSLERHRPSAPQPASEGQRADRRDHVTYRRRLYHPMGRRLVLLAAPENSCTMTMMLHTSCPGWPRNREARLPTQPHLLRRQRHRPRAVALYQM